MPLMSEFATNGMKPSHFVVRESFLLVLRMEKVVFDTVSKAVPANLDTVGCLDPRANPTDYFNLKPGELSTLLMNGLG
jgi:hypothetical protein